MCMSSLPIVDEFLRSVVALTVSTDYQKRYKTPDPSGDEFSRPDHIYVGLGPPVRRKGHTLSHLCLRFKKCSQKLTQIRH